jgi:hypothetical protein
MTIVTTKKTTVHPTWTPERIREHTARIMATQYCATMSILSKYGEPAITEFDNATRSRKVEYYRSQGVKTPMDLIRTMAETEANIFGSNIEIWGEDNNASMTYNMCGMYNAMQKYCGLTKEQEEKMGTHFGNYIERLGREFGFTGSVTWEQPGGTITFKK